MSKKNKTREKENENLKEFEAFEPGKDDEDSQDVEWHIEQAIKKLPEEDHVKSRIIHVSLEEALNWLRTFR